MLVVELNKLNLAVIIVTIVITEIILHATIIVTIVITETILRAITTIKMVAIAIAIAIVVVVALVGFATLVKTVRKAQIVMNQMKFKNQMNRSITIRLKYLAI